MAFDVRNLAINKMRSPMAYALGVKLELEVTAMPPRVAQVMGEMFEKFALLESVERTHIAKINAHESTMQRIITRLGPVDMKVAMLTPVDLRTMLDDIEQMMRELSRQLELIRNLSV